MSKKYRYILHKNEKDYGVLHDGYNLHEDAKMFWDFFTNSFAKNDPWLWLNYFAVGNGKIILGFNTKMSDTIKKRLEEYRYIVEEK